MFHRVKSKHDIQHEGGGSSDKDNETTPDDVKMNDNAGSTPYPKGLNQSAVTSTKSEIIPDSIGLAQGLTMISKMSFFPIVGMLFHPMYMLVNAQILGNMELDPKKCGKDATEEMLKSFECVTAETYLASFGLASATMGIFVLAPGICFNLGLMNILPQAFGAKKFQLCGAYLNRFIVATLILFVPFLIPMSFVEYLFLYMGQSEHVSYLAGLYCKIVAPGVIFYFVGQAHAMLAGSQGKPEISFAMIVSSAITHFFVAKVLTDVYDLKFLGITIASSIHFIVRGVVGTVLVRYGKNKNFKKSVIPICSSDSFKDMGPIFKLGFQSIMLKVMGWWAFDVFTLLASQLDERSIAAQTILRNIGLFTYMIPVGLSSAINFFTGKYIGKDRVDLAHTLSNYTMYITYFWSFAISGLLWLLEDNVMHFYTDSAPVIAAMKPAWIVILVFVLFDCVQGVSAGNISGLGLMKKVTWVTAINYWVVGIPLSLYTMFKLNMGLQGLWFGPTAAVFLNTVIYQYVINAADWQQIADDFKEKMKKDSENLEAKEAVEDDDGAKE